MKARSLTSLLAIVGALSAGGAYGQEGREFCDDLFTELTVGQFAQWTFTMEDQRELVISMAVVDKVERPDGALYWLEMVVPIPVGNAEVAAQMLVPGFPFDGAEMQDYIIKYGEQEALRVPPSQLGELPGSGWREECRNADAEYVGIEQVAVEGVGSFDAHHVRTTGESEGHWYFSPQVPFAMLKFEAAEGRMVVSRIGYDYEAVIDRSTVQ